jgi:hypothetical protein
MLFFSPTVWGTRRTNKSVEKIIKRMMYGRAGLDLLEKKFSISFDCYFNKTIKISNKDDRKSFTKRMEESILNRC